MTFNSQRSVAVPEQSGRRIIVIMDPFEFEKLSYDPLQRQKLNQPGVLAVPDDLDPGTDALLEQLDHQGLWLRGSVLTQNPYNRDQYEVSAEPHVVFAQTRLRVMVRMFYLLGAREFKYLELEKRNDSTKAAAKGGGGKGPLKGDASWSSDTDDSLRRGSAIHHTWSGGAPDPAAARTLLAASHLSHDDALDTLIALREGPDNQHKSWVETFDLLRESTTVIDLAAKVRAGLYGGELSGKKARKQRTEFSVRYEIKY